LSKTLLAVSCPTSSENFRGLYFLAKGIYIRKLIISYTSGEKLIKQPRFPEETQKASKQSLNTLPEDFSSFSDVKKRFYQGSPGGDPRVFTSFLSSLPTQRLGQTATQGCSTSPPQKMQSQS
jgi:hypothetical protein